MKITASQIIGRKPVARLALLLVGTLLGIALSYFITLAFQLQTVRAELQSYAARLVHIGEKLGEEDTQAIEAVTHDNLGFCSDQELDFMRGYVYRSPHIRDLGRTQDGKLICSTGIGRLLTPKSMPSPDITTGTLKLYVRAPLVFSNRATGFIVEDQGVSIVLNPEAIENFEEPPRFYIALLFDRVNHHLMQTYGPMLPLTMDEVLAGKSIERNGILYQPLCSQTSMVCQVAAEPRTDILSRGKLLFPLTMTTGGLLGAAAALITILLHTRRRSMEQQLRRAIQSDGLSIVYQPIVDLATQAIVGAEALVRWTNEENVFVRPDIFVAVAEESGFICDITQIVVRRVVRELGDLLRTDSFRVTVNITAQDLGNPDFLRSLEQRLGAAKVKHSAIGLELTERSTASHEEAIQAVAKLKDAGHMVYIDDFGTGYSSLAYLHQLAANAIKIDRTFTQTVGTGAVTASVVPQILAMATQLNLLVVVEGIETREQAEYFRTAGPGILGQGWFFGQPMSAEKLRSLLRDRIV